MKRTWLGAAIAACFTAVLVAQPAAAGFSEWDSNDDVGIDNDEFGTGFHDRGIYETWDADNDGTMSEREFNEGVYGTYDRDNNGVIDENEYDMLDDDIGPDGRWGL
ncbi:MAG: hypothetical protein RIE84_05870 [Parvibaculum sp.]|uniref:hypothetical protein n=1 Tax=Parvibaculum sp. TaxID=2024848 RepID=UPI0032EACE01